MTDTEPSANSSTPTATDPRPPRRPARTVALAVGALVVIGLAFAAVRGAQAARSALAAKRALLAAEADLRATRVGAARTHLAAAEEGFARARRQLRSTGPIGALARAVPFVRVQVRGMEAFTEAGEVLAQAGGPIADAAARVADPRDRTVTVESALDTLRTVHGSLKDGVASLDAATTKVRKLDGYRLIGPLGDARRDLLSRLPRIRERAGSAEKGLAALITFAGGSGPRRYLVLSQNPDEVRPTGGFIGTYGVLATASGRLTLDRFDGIEGWLGAHRDAALPPDQAGHPLPFFDPPRPQNLANVNNVPDWPAAARLAMSLWQRGGEEPVQGVVSITPAFLTRALVVLGPVRVSGYDETVSAQNALERIEFHTHSPAAPGRAAGDRKDFVAALAQEVMRALLAAPATKWHPLAREIGHSFDAREAMVWSSDADVAAASATRRWDGTLPDSFGDFFYNGEFESAAKNGRGLKRTYDHRVELRSDGSARITTSITIANTEPPGPLNQHAYTYITIYGPQGATLDPTSDAHEVPETPIAGHPGVAWFRSAPPLGQATLKVVWNAPAVARPAAEGSLEYGLWWMKLPDHHGDVLNLDVIPPPGWRWEGKAPPKTYALDRDLIDTWELVRG